MDTKVVLKKLPTKYLPKAFLKSSRVQWDNNFVQLTRMVPQGMTSNLEPKIIIQIKLGANSVNLIVEDTTTAIGIFEAVTEILYADRDALNACRIKERDAYLKFQKLKKSTELQPQSSDPTRADKKLAANFTTKTSIKHLLSTKK
jgi:hypothetical protein